MGEGVGDGVGEEGGRGEGEGEGGGVRDRTSTLLPVVVETIRAHVITVDDVLKHVQRFKKKNKKKQKANQM